MEYRESFEGHFDLIDNDSCQGWVWDSREPDANIKIDIYDSDKKIETITADIFRQDLRDAGKGKGYHGFNYSIPENFRDGNKHTFHIKFSGTDIELFGSPKAVKLKTPRKGIFKKLKSLFIK